MSDVKEDFEMFASEYDEWIDKACPFYHEAMDTLMQAAPPNVHFILELGCGTGNLSKLLLEAYPKATMTVVDVATNMLAITKEKLSGYSQQVHFVESYFEKFHSEYKYDLIASSLAIHHLEGKQKDHFFDKAYTMLHSGGALILMDKVEGALPEYKKMNHDAWMATMHANGLSEEKIASVLEKQKAHDHWEPLFSQLAMLKRAGFIGIEVFFKKQGIAVFGGKKY